MMQVLDDLAPLSPKEMLANTPKELALLEALRLLFGSLRFVSGLPEVQLNKVANRRGSPESVKVAMAISDDDREHFLTAKQIYLQLRDLSHAGPA